MGPTVPRSITAPLTAARDFAVLGSGAAGCPSGPGRTVDAVKFPTWLSGVVPRLRRGGRAGALDRLELELSAVFAEIDREQRTNPRTAAALAALSEARVTRASYDAASGSLLLESDAGRYLLAVPAQPGCEQIEVMAALEPCSVTTLGSADAAVLLRSWSWTYRIHYNAVVRAEPG